MKQKTMTTKTVIMTGMFTAVLAVLSIIQIPIPSGVPITLQTFAVALCGCVLGAKLGAMSALIYMLIGAIGLPVFSGMSSGIRVIAGPTGGFIYGFIVMAFLCGIGSVYKNYAVQGVLSLAGLLACHLCGAIHFMFITGTSFLQSVMIVSVPYLMKDILSVVAAIVLGRAVCRALTAANLMEFRHEA